MRVLVVGAGATGGYFGGRLAQAGRDVTFLVRPGRAAVLRERGLRIVGLGEQTVLTPELVTAPGLATASLSGQEAARFDLVLLTVKESGLVASIADLAPAVGPDTLIIPVLNGMRQVDLLVERFGERAVLGGVALAVTAVDEHGDVVRLAGLGSLSYGARDRRPDPRLDDVHRTLSGAGFDTELSPDIVAAMWAKWVFIASLGAVNTLMRGTVGEAAAVPGGARIAETVVAEAASVASAAGYPLPEPRLDGIRATLTRPASDDTSSLYRDLAAGRPVEAEQIFGDLVGRADALNVPVPLLTVATAHLRVHQNRLTAAR